jgi:tetratricopeptide (TPR) repeat protein
MNQSKLTSFLYPCTLFIVILVSIIFLSYNYPTKVADAAFSVRLPSVAFLFDETAPRARDIGNYYFNVDGSGSYNLEKARDYFETAIELDPQIIDAWHQLARIDFLEGDFARSLFKINKQIELHGTNFMASYYIRGLVLGYMGQYKNATEDLALFLTWDTSNWAAYNDLAWLYFSEGEYRDALDAADKGLQHAPENPWLLNIRGVSLLNLGEYDDARNSLQKAYEKAELLTDRDWHKAYPGNYPSDSSRGLEEMRVAIMHNLELVGN